MNIKNILSLRTKGKKKIILWMQSNWKKLNPCGFSDNI